MSVNLTFFDTEKSIVESNESVSVGQKGLFSTIDNYCTADSMDLNKVLIRHSASTFFARVSGESFCDEGIYDGDLLIIDKSVDVYSGAVVVVYLDGDFTLVKAEITKRVICFKTATAIIDNSDINVWGVVRYVIKKL